MTVFSERELAYLRNERLLGRLATVGADGTPHVVPVGWSLDETGTLIRIGGRSPARIVSWGPHSGSTIEDTYRARDAERPTSAT